MRCGRRGGVKPSCLYFSLGSYIYGYLEKGIQTPAGPHNHHEDEVDSDQKVVN
jgi:hypothetical protein